MLRCLVWVEQRKAAEYALLIWCNKPEAAGDNPSALLMGVRNAISLQLSA